MKRVALLTVFFYVCTFAAPQRSQAAVSVALIAAAAVGTAMMSASIGTYYAQNGVMPEYVTSTANAVASAADAVFQPSYLAQGVYHLFTPDSLTTAKDYYFGKAAAVGAKIGDIVDVVKDSAAGLYTDFKNLLNENTADSTLTSPLVISQIINTPLGIVRYNGISAILSTYYSLGKIPSIYSAGKFANTAEGGWLSVYNNEIYLARLSPDYPGYWELDRLHITLVSDEDITNPIVDGAIDYPGLKSQLQANLDAALADEIRSAVQAMPADQKILSSDPAPSAVPAENASPITNNDISNFFTSNTTNIYNQYLTAIQSEDTTITNEVAKAAAETAAAQEEEAEKEEEETFGEITDSAFTEPYNPGEFNIPARFTQFLNNVKSSGLFSFSNDFFNSLPGGGSSVYEIEAGQYGHHTIDLSDTLSTGLAVLKTILLVCFGFLSIRAVIMKR